MKKSRFSSFVIMLVLVSACCAAVRVKFPESTTLCGIKTQDKFTDVVKKYGNNYILTEYGTESPTWSVIYNDPKTPAYLVVNSGDSPFQGIKKSRVCSIVLKKGYYKGKKGHFATKSFASLGTFLGAKLGDSRQDLQKRYPKIHFWKYRGPQHGNVDVQSPKDWSCCYIFTMEKGKVVEIFSGFIS